MVQPEWRDRPDGATGREDHYLVRHLERLPLNTPYPEMAWRVAGVCAGVVTHARLRPPLYVDATGVGTPVVDVLREAQVQAELIGVYFTHGDKRVPKQDARGRTVELSLGKAWLVSRLQALLQGGRLHLPQTPEARALGKELLDYEIKVDEDANDKYGAFKTGVHDDLVTALGLAVQADPPQRAVFAQGVAKGWGYQRTWT